jgi:hypothetical protein
MTHHHPFRFGALYACISLIAACVGGNATAAAAPLALTAKVCPGGVQGTAYVGCTVVATGGTTPYIFSIANTPTYPLLPEGMSINSTTGLISSSQIGGQGYYQTKVVVKDATGASVSRIMGFSIAGRNAFLAQIFPANSIFHHRVDEATTGLPVDTSPAAPIPSVYIASTIKPFFGNNGYPPFPNGIPAFSVPATQPNVAVTTTVYQSYFSAGPFPANAPIEGSSTSVAAGGDGHVSIYQAAGAGHAARLYELWQGIKKSNGTWTTSSNAEWANTDGNAMPPQDYGTSDAAGLPVGPLVVNADEVLGTGTPTAPNGTIRHPIRFTLNHMLNYWVWPATSTAGVGSCTAKGGATIGTRQLLSQSAPPASCTQSAAPGQIYRLKASVANPACAMTSPQANVIIAGLRNYGMILSDNGQSGGLIGTPDSRWRDDDLACLRSLNLGNFEPVNVSSIMLSPTSGQTTH